MSLSNYLISIQRKFLRLFVQVITGHSTLNEHLHRMGKSPSNRCAFCESDVESSIHFLGKCDGFVEQRLDEMDGQIFSSEEIRTIKPVKLMQFIISTGRFNSNEVVPQ